MAVLYFGFGVSKGDREKGEPSSNGSVNAATVTCRDLGIGNPDTAAGKHLKAHPKKRADLARQLGSRGFGSQGTEKQRTRAMIEAISFVCVTAKSPDLRPTKPALAFAREARSLSQDGGQTSAQQGTAEIEQVLEEEMGSRLGGFSRHSCTRFFDTRYVCEGAGNYAEVRYDRLWDAEVAPDGTVIFSPKN